MGVVEDIGAMSHDVVRQGQMLARLRSTELGEAQVAWLEARAALRVATADRDRSMGLRKDGVVSESQWLRVESEYQRAEGACAQAERRLALAGMSAQQIEALESTGRRLGELTLASPADGVVLQSAVSRGQALAAGEVAFTVADLSRLWVTVHVPVSRVEQVKQGAKATVHVPGGARQGWTGVLGSLGGSADPENQTVEGRVVVTNAGGQLRPGMYAQVEVVGTPTKALMVPASAVFSVGNQSYVFQKLSETRFRPLSVAADAPVGAWIPVHGPGVERGMEVVSTGLAELKSHWLYSGGE